MNAISGLIYMNGRPADPLLLERMTEWAAPWAAERAGVWHKDSIGLGHLVAFDMPEAQQSRLPLTRNELALTADARIDNREEIIAALGLLDSPAVSISDGELILRAYEKWGEECPHRLVGDFAFALWDGADQKLFCARDPMGVKPFYYHHGTDAFVFGSNIKAILQIAEVPRNLDELSVAYYISRISEDCVRTFYKGIARLPGGHALTVKGNRLRLREYWDPDLTHEIRLKSSDEYGEAFREVFYEAVRCRLRSVAPVGSALSGGLDSSSIVCAGRSILRDEGNGRALHSFSAIFPSVAEIDARIDERRYINEVVSGNSLIHHNVRADQVSPVQDFMFDGDEPSPAPNAYMDWLLATEARSSGVDVLMSGFDGDTAVSHGYELLPHLFRRFRWLKMAEEIQALSKRHNCPARAILKFYILPHFTPAPVTWLWRLFRGRNRPAWMENNIINRDFARRTGLHESWRHLMKTKHPRVRSPRHEHKMAVRSGAMMNSLGIMRSIADAASVDIRYPFFDRRVIEFCLAIPLEEKLQNGLNRSVLRRAMRDDLPPLLQSRTSKGRLSSCFDTRLWHWERDKIRRILAGKSSLIADYVDMNLLSGGFARFDLSPTRCGKWDTFNLFLAEVLACWLEKSGLKP